MCCSILLLVVIKITKTNHVVTCISRNIGNSLIVAMLRIIASNIGAFEHLE